MKSPIIFNHIPRTGGSTLRIILNRVYGAEKVFFIKSMDISGSLEEFIAEHSKNDAPEYKVISGHGAELFTDFYTNPLKITILREPVSMFISQYHYLKESPNSNFLEEVSALNSFEAYIDYAISRGQDNMLCRMLGGPQQWLLTDDHADMNTMGKSMLEVAKDTLHKYDVILDQGNFNAGIYALSFLLGWNRIPLYRKSNKSKNTSASITDKTTERLQHLLRFDIELYNYFKKAKLDIAIINNEKSLNYKVFRIRQSTINILSGILAKP